MQIVIGCRCGFFIAGAIAAFLNRDAVMRYLGPDAKRPTAYAVASVAGIILAVCSCSVLPMFAGIYAMGAGLGPASAFLYSGPAINVMAVFLSARVLGLDLGVARFIGAIAGSITNPADTAGAGSARELESRRPCAVAIKRTYRLHTPGIIGIGAQAAQIMVRTAS